MKGGIMANFCRAPRILAHLFPGQNPLPGYERVKECGYLTLRQNC